MWKSWYTEINTNTIDNPRLKTPKAKNKNIKYKKVTKSLLWHSDIQLYYWKLWLYIFLHCYPHTWYSLNCSERKAIINRQIEKFLINTTREDKHGLMMFIFCRGFVFYLLYLYLFRYISIQHDFPFIRYTQKNLGLWMELSFSCFTCFIIVQINCAINTYYLLNIVFWVCK
jgi:hypothetical protein